MIDVRPFVALRPRAGLAARICAPPYDVVTAEEARLVAARNPLTFLRVSRAEIDLPVGVDPHGPQVYAQARRTFREMIEGGLLVQDPRPAYYVYRLTMGERSQTGLVAVVACQDYLDGRIRRHELTRPDKEDDRARHIETLNAQTGPAFLVYRSMAELDQLLEQHASTQPMTDFVDGAGVRHAVWAIHDEHGIESIRDVTAGIRRLYIADGHHRTAAAARVSVLLQGRGGSSHFLGVLFPHDQLRILPYNRVLKDLNGQAPAALVARLGTAMQVIEKRPDTQPGLHEVDVYVSGNWHRYGFRDTTVGGTDPVERLDVSMLQRDVLGPVFGIEDPRRDGRIGFVGGVRGIGELEQLVKSGEYACAFAMHPTQIEDMIAIADSGGLMPPKSTWFEPKLSDGLFTYIFGSVA